MPPLSVVIIARDEADRLPEALRSVAFADERLVLDSGSADGTPEVARALGARVVETDWPGHVAQKNRALGLATHAWVLSLDADERVSPALAASIRVALAEEPAVDGFAVARRNHYLGQPLGWGGWYPDRRVRLVRRARARWGGTDPHDRLEVDGPIARLHGDLDHHPYRSAQEHLDTIARYARRAAEVDPTPGHAWDPVGRATWRFLRGYLLQLGFLDGRAGLSVAWLGARYTHLKWALRASRDGSESGRDDR
ncbi:MAG: glycosyltransferase family 2 protein [Pseudomonadota bacterium]